MIKRLMLGFRVLPDEQLDQGAKQGFPTLPDIVSEFKEAKIEREFSL
jgi:hypothetical protein